MTTGFDALWVDAWLLSDLNSSAPPTIYHRCGARVVAVDRNGAKRPEDCTITCYGPPDAPQKTVRDYWTRKLTILPCGEWDLMTQIWELNQKDLSKIFFQLPSEASELFKLVQDPKTPYTYTRLATPLECWEYYHKAATYMASKEEE
jgi:hypothetical protein